MSSISFGFGGVIGVQHFEGTGIGTAHGYFDTQFTGGSIVTDTSGEMQTLSCVRTQLGCDQPVLRTRHFLNISAVMLQLNTFLPAVSGVAVNDRPSFRRKTLALKPFIEGLGTHTRATHRCREE